jgi:hypothetical protein
MEASDGGIYNRGAGPQTVLCETVQRNLNLFG